MSRRRLLVTCGHLQRHIERYRADLEADGVELVMPPLTAQQFSADEMKGLVIDADTVIAGDDVIDAEVLAAGRAGRLRAVIKWGIGTDGIDKAAASSLGIPVFNTPGAFSDEVADLALGYVLSLARAIPTIDAAVRGSQWARHEGMSLAGKTAGIVGLGGVGRAIAVRCRAFGMTVVGTDVVPMATEVARELVITQMPLEGVLEAADFVILACSLTPENRHMLDAATFKRMKRGAFLVNVARGPLVDERALIAALSSGHLAGAGLDVFETEPLPAESPLRDLENCILGSHGGFSTAEAIDRVNMLTIEIARRVLGLGNCAPECARPGGPETGARRARRPSPAPDSAVRPRRTPGTARKARASLPWNSSENSGKEAYRVESKTTGSHLVHQSVNPNGAHGPAMKALVTGGAGYVGSFVARELRRAGYRVVVYDDLSSGCRSAVPREELVVGDFGAKEALLRLFERHRFEAVLHFAASIDVAESVSKPLRYYRNNTFGTLSLLEACREGGVDKFIFSSTAAVYGIPSRLPVVEKAPLLPISPYGASKMMAERIVRDLAAASGLRYVILRYFNVAGADPSERMGEGAVQSTHLIKTACRVALGQQPKMTIFGDDYPTPDGTCVRDYIHVEDIASAHVAALRHLTEGGDSLVLNCGYGHGASVREVVEVVKRVSGVDFPVEVGAHRAGDPPILVADNGRIKAAFDWQPRHDDLEFIVGTAYAWEKVVSRK